MVPIPAATQGTLTPDIHSCSSITDFGLPQGRPGVVRAVSQALAYFLSKSKLDERL